jgi:hypothetical protein
MTKVRKKKLLGTPGVSTLNNQKTTPSSLSVLKERNTTKSDDESTENTEDSPEPPSSDYVHEEKLKIDMLVATTTDPIHVRTQATIALQRLFEGDKSRRIVPFLSRYQTSHPNVKSTENLPHNQDDLTIYVSNPTVHSNSKTTSQVRLIFYVRTQSTKQNLRTLKQTNGTHDWLKLHEIYIELMELETSDNERIGMIIGKAPRITSLSDLRDSLRMQVSNYNLDHSLKTDTPPFQLKIDNIGKASDQTRTRAITVTCSKVHAKLLTTILQQTFPSNTNQPFLSYSVFYSLDTTIRHSILKQHHQRTSGRSMIDVTIPDFHLLSDLVMIDKKATSLREAISNISKPDGSRLHMDIDNATKNGDTIMIVAPQDMDLAKKFVGHWIHTNHKQPIDWSTSQTFHSATHRLDFSSRTSAAGFANDFPPLVITTTKTLPSASNTIKKKPPTTTATTHPSHQAWKNLSYSTDNTKNTASIHRDNATAKTTASSSGASQFTSSLDNDINHELSILQDRCTTLQYRLSLSESRATLMGLNAAHHQRHTEALNAHIFNRLNNIERVGDYQNKINQNLVLTLSTTTDDDREAGLMDLGQRIDAKIRLRKAEKQNRPQVRSALVAQISLSPDLTNLQLRANLHVRRLKTRLEQLSRKSPTDEEDSSDSSISTLGLSQYDKDDFDLLDSDAEASCSDDQMSCSQPSKLSRQDLPPSDNNIDTNIHSDIITELASIFESSTEILHPPLHNSYLSDTTSSLQRATHAATSKVSLDEEMSCPDSTWEQPPPEFFEEWTTTTTKPAKSPHNAKKAQGPPGRLSPPTVTSVHSVTANRYAVLEELPISRPPVDHSQQSIDNGISSETLPTAEPSTITKRDDTISPSPSQSTQPSQLAGILRPNSTSNTALPTGPSKGDYSILSFFAAKHLKNKGSPRKKKARTLQTSPSRGNTVPHVDSHATTDGTFPLDPLIASPPRRLSTMQNRQTSTRFDNACAIELDIDNTTQLSPPQDAMSTTSDQSPSGTSSYDSDDQSHHSTEHLCLETNAMATLHSPGHRTTSTAALHFTRHDDVSETSTLLASDDDASMDINPSTTPNHQDRSPLPLTSSPPSTSSQYKNSTPAVEGNAG